MNSLPPAPARIVPGRTAGPNAVPGIRLRLLVLLLAVSTGGCGSIYHRTGAGFAADPCARLQSRVDEARRAAKTADDANQTLHARLQSARGNPAIATDFDRVERAAHELERRIAAAQDGVPLCADGSRFATELEQLRARAGALLEAVHALREKHGALPAP